jgi:hypothetical protein
MMSGWNGFLLFVMVVSVSANPILEKIEALEKKLALQEELMQEIRSLRAEVKEMKVAQELAQEDLDYVLEQEPVKSFSGGLTFGGYVDVEFSNRKSKGKRVPSKFDQHRFIFDVAADLGSKMRFVSELEFEHSADSIGMEQAYIDYRFQEKKGFRLGSILVPVGRFNYQHDAPLRELSERPKLLKSLIPSTWFDTGAGFFGSTGSKKHPMSFEIYVMNGLQDDGFKLAEGTGLRSLRKKGREKTEANNNKALTGRVGIQVNSKTELGLSFYRNNVGAYSAAKTLGGGRDLQLVALDWEREISSRLDWTGEYLRGDVDANTNSAVAATAFTAGGTGYDFSGWYTQFNYILDENEKYRAILRLGKTDTAHGIQNGGDIRERVLGLSFRPNQTSVFKLEYHWEDELSNVILGQKLSNDGWVLGAATYF